MIGLYEGFADAGRLHYSVNTAHEVLGAHRDEESDEDKADAGRDGAEDLGFLLLAVAALILRFRVEKLRVRFELENEVEAVEDEHDDGCASREYQDTLVRALGTVGERGVEGSGDDERGCGDCH